MIVLSDNCISSKKWLDENFGIIVDDELISIKDLDIIFKDKSQTSWDYPLSEINHLIETANDLEDAGEDYNIQLVQFKDCYRFCELN